MGRRHVPPPRPGRALWECAGPGLATAFAAQPAAPPDSRAWASLGSSAEQTHPLLRVDRVGSGYVGNFPQAEGTLFLLH